MLAYPMGRLNLKGMNDKVKYVQFLHDASEVKFNAGTGEDAGSLSLQLPIQKPPVEIAVLEVYLK
jgi:alpha-L-fucosidase